MRTYRFTYRLSGFMYDPSLPSFDIHAKTLRVARKRAQMRLKEIVRDMSAGHWMIESRGPGTARPIWYPYHFLRGWVSRGFEVRRDRPKRVLTTEQILESTAKSRAAFSAFMSPVIKDVIESAAVMADLFSTMTMEPIASDAYVMPMVTPMAREEWPPRPSSCKGQGTCY